MKSIEEYNKEAELETELTIQKFRQLSNVYGAQNDSRYYQIVTSPSIKEYIMRNRKRGLYNCNHCKKAYHSIYDLALHFDEYQVKRPYNCNFCGCPYTVLGFASTNERNRHINSVHGKKNYVCSDCNQAFSRVDQLNAHISRTHRNPHSRFNKKLNKQKSMNFGSDSMDSFTNDSEQQITLLSGAPDVLSNALHPGVHSGMSPGVQTSLPIGYPAGYQNSYQQILPPVMPNSLPNVVPSGLPSLSNVLSDPYTLLTAPNSSESSASSSSSFSGGQSQYQEHLENTGFLNGIHDSNDKKLSKKQSRKLREKKSLMRMNGYNDKKNKLEIGFLIN